MGGGLLSPIQLCVGNGVRAGGLIFNILAISSEFALKILYISMIGRFTHQMGDQIIGVLLNHYEPAIGE